MKIVTVSEQPGSPNPHGVTVRALHTNEHVQVNHVTLAPGDKLRWHITPVDVFFYVLQGTAQVEIGDESETVQAGSLVESPLGIKHRILNQGDTELCVLVVKTPAQQASTQLL